MQLFNFVLQHIIAKSRTELIQLFDHMTVSSYDIVRILALSKQFL